MPLQIFLFRSDPCLTLIREENVDANPRLRAVLQSMRERAHDFIENGTCFFKVLRINFLFICSFLFFTGSLKPFLIAFHLLLVAFILFCCEGN